MGCPSGTELFIVVVVVMLVMGVNRLPQIGDGLGRAIRNFKRGLQGENEIDVTPPKKKLSSNSDPSGSHDSHGPRDRSRGSAKDGD